MLYSVVFFETSKVFERIWGGILLGEVYLYSLSFVNSGIKSSPILLFFPFFHFITCTSIIFVRFFIWVFCLVLTLDDKVLIDSL